MSPNAALGSGAPPTCTTQQLKLAILMLLTALCIALCVGKPAIPSVSRISPGDITRTSFKVSTKWSKDVLSGATVPE